MNDFHCFCSPIAVYLIAAVFFKQLPLEFSAILGKLLPAITGGANLMLMGVYSYLSETTAEADRTMRFGIFAQIVPLIPIASIPWSGYLFQHLRYISMCSSITKTVRLLQLLQFSFITHRIAAHLHTNQFGWNILRDFLPKRSGTSKKR